MLLILWCIHFYTYREIKKTFRNFKWQLRLFAENKIFISSFFSIWVFFCGYWFFSKEKDWNIPISFYYFHPLTNFTHFFSVLKLRWLSCTLNHDAFNYHTVPWWDLCIHFWRLLYDWFDWLHFLQSWNHPLPLIKEGLTSSNLAIRVGMKHKRYCLEVRFFSLTYVYEKKTKLFTVLYSLFFLNFQNKKKNFPLEIKNQYPIFTGRGKSAYI